MCLQRNKNKQPSYLSLTTQLAHNAVMTGKYSTTGPAIVFCGSREILKDKPQRPVGRRRECSGLTSMSRRTLCLGLFAQEFDKKRKDWKPTFFLFAEKVLLKRHVNLQKLVIVLSQTEPAKSSCKCPVDLRKGTEGNRKGSMEHLETTTKVNRQQRTKRFVQRAVQGRQMVLPGNLPSCLSEKS